MKHWKRLAMLTILTLVGTTGLGLAEEQAASSDPKSGSIEMTEVEIEGTLGDIVETFKLNQMEILGDMDQPRITYDEPWILPEPFDMDTSDATTRELIEKAYRPVDRDSLGVQAGLIIGPPGDEASSKLASGRKTGILGFASFRK